MNNQECKVIPEIISNKSDKPSFYPYRVKISKCSGSCNNINDPYAKLCVLDVVKNMNVEVFNLVSRTNEAKYINWHGTCKCKCRLDAIVCNNKQRLSEDKCRCECRELIDKWICLEEFIWNPSNCEFESDKSYDAGEYLDRKNCKCRKRLIDKLVEECKENIDEKKLHSNKMMYNSTLDNCEKVCSSCTVYIVLFVIFFIISISISSVFMYFLWCLKIKYIEILSKLMSKIVHITLLMTWSILKDFGWRLVKIDRKLYKLMIMKILIV